MFQFVNELAAPSIALQPVIISVLFSADDAFHGAVSFVAHNDRQLRLSILHERTDGSIASYDLAGDETLIATQVSDAEALVLLARRSGAIVASAVFEIDLSLVESVGQLLIPRSLCNILLSQEAAPEQRRTAPLLVQPAEVVEVRA